MKKRAMKGEAARPSSHRPPNRQLSAARQKLMLPENWILREALSTLSLMRPKIVEVKVAVGAENEGVLVRFFASTRKLKLTRSVTLNCLLKEASV
jgi:hypothetical protein